MTNHTTLELHEGDNFIFALDVSASMGQQDCPGNLSRFNFSIEKMKQFCHEASKFSSEGICIFKFGHNVTKFDHITEDKIDPIIASSQPVEMATLTNKVIADAYQEHLEDGHEDTFLFIITDGEPTNGQLVVDELSKISANMKGEFKVIFLIVGMSSFSLQEYLLDLEKRFSMVTVLNLAEVSFMAAVGAGINAPEAA